MFENTNCWEYFKQKNKIDKELAEGIITPKQYEEKMRTLASEVDSRNHNSYR